MENYNYTNLKEFNTVLRLYNVEADPGKENSRMRQHHGLLYRVLDDQGHSIGRPLKASFFDFKPTLQHLEEKFRLNQTLRQQQHLHQRVEVYVDWELSGKKLSLGKLKTTLLRNGIHLELNKDKAGKITDVAYVDFNHRCSIEADALKESCQKESIQKLSLRQEVESEHLSHRHRHRHHLGL